ncbi:MAG TPA: DUF1289 domain-containing protein [Pseudorhodoplanes sp.]|jgi:predicted Fe-S protein YdhL (DUF1289 family)|nr:DUF1289 domain-containing protein [Pseudorhodoplanes sp.]
MAAVSTPCINVCILDPRTGLCRGCGRNADEIAAWAAMSEAERIRIMAKLPERMAASRAPAEKTG